MYQMLVFLSYATKANKILFGKRCNTNVEIQKKYKNFVNYQHYLTFDLRKVPMQANYCAACNTSLKYISKLNINNKNSILQGNSPYSGVHFWSKEVSLYIYIFLLTLMNHVHLILYQQSFYQFCKYLLDHQIVLQTPCTDEGQV